MDILQLIILAPNKKIILNKKFYDGNDLLEDQFLNQLKSYTDLSYSPVAHIRDKQLVTLNRNGIFYSVLASLKLCSIFAIEILQRFYDLVCVVLKSTEVNNIIGKISLIHDILDKYMENGLVQLVNAHQMQIEGLKIKLSNSDFSTSTPFADLEKTCKVFIDVIERFSVILNENDSIIQCNLIGQVDFECEYFKSISNLLIHFNEILVQKGPPLGFEKKVLLKRVILNKNVNQQKFDTDKILSICPIDEKITLMTYEARDAMLGLPLRVYTKIDKNLNKLVTLTITIRGELHSNNYLFNNLKCCLNTSDHVSGITAICGENGYPVDCLFKNCQLFFNVKTLKGKETISLIFKILTNTDHSTTDRYLFGPLNLNFEISGYALSGLNIVSLDFDSNLTRSEKWIRYGTVSDTYLIDTNI